MVFVCLSISLRFSEEGPLCTEFAHSRMFIPSSMIETVCDTTLSALSLFRVDIGEPLLRLPPDDAVLSPSLLAGLLSLVIAIRGKVIACSSLKVGLTLRLLRSCSIDIQADVVGFRYRFLFLGH